MRGSFISHTDRNHEALVRLGAAGSVFGVHGVAAVREGGGEDLGPINSGRLSYDPRVPRGLAGGLEIDVPDQ